MKMRMDILINAVLLWVILTGICFSQSSLLNIPGIVEPVRDVTMSFSISGRIDRILFNEGDRISRNEAVIMLDKKLEELEVEKNKMIMDSRVELDAARVKVDILDRLLRADEALYHETKSISREELDKKRLEYKLAQAELAQLHHTEKLEKVKYDSSVETLNQRIIASPITGILVKLFFEAGENCDANEPVARIVDTSTCRLVCTIEENIGHTLKNGQSIDVKIVSGAGEVNRKAKIIFVSPVVDPASNLMEVKAEFDNIDGSIRPGEKGFLVLPKHSQN